MDNKERTAWILLWDEVEMWYGDTSKKETGKQFLERMQRQFNLQVKIPMDKEEVVDHLNTTGI